MLSGLICCLDFGQDHPKLEMGPSNYRGCGGELEDCLETSDTLVDVVHLAEALSQAQQGNVGWVSLV